MTGANTGLGFAAVLKYAQKGVSRLLLAVRSIQAGEDAKSKIAQQSRLDDDFISAYEHGIVVRSTDGVERRWFPRILTYSADVSETKQLAARDYEDLLQVCIAERVGTLLLRSTNASPFSVQSLCLKDFSPTNDTTSAS